MWDYLWYMSCGQRCCCGWSETLLDRLLDGLKIVLVWSGGKVGGLWESLAKLSVAGSGIVVLAQRPMTESLSEKVLKHFMKISR